MSTKKKFGNELDKKQKHIPFPSLVADEQEWNQFFELRKAKRKQAMDALFSYYGIKKDFFPCWVKLAWSLADDFVPAMQFQKPRGQPKKWDMQTRMALHALIVLHKEQNPKKPMKTIYKDILKEVEGTILASVISKDTAPKTIQNEYENFLSRTENVLIKHFEKKASKVDQLAFYKELLTGNF